jgi:hypothetical protein
MYAGVPYCPRFFAETTLVERGINLISYECYIYIVVKVKQLLCRPVVRTSYWVCLNMGLGDMSASFPTHLWYSRVS